jgi:GNAT superfamily N-acetyltransferase
MNRTIHIRRAEKHDHATLATIFLEARCCAYRWRDPVDLKLEDFAVQTAGEVIFLAEDEQQEILGFISVWVSDRFVHHLFVAPDHQHNGIGRCLLESLASWLPLPYRLKCNEKNLVARAFYTKNGWIEVGRGSDEHGDYLMLEYNPVNQSNLPT